MIGVKLTEQGVKVFTNQTLDNLTREIEQRTIAQACSSPIKEYATKIIHA